MSSLLLNLSLRASGYLLGTVLILVGSFGESFAQTTVSDTSTYTLSAGVNSIDFQWTAALPRGAEAELTSLSLETEGDAALLALNAAFAKTYPSIAGPIFTAYFQAERKDQQSNQKQLSFTIRVSYKQTTGGRLSARSGPQEPTNSVLGDGKIIKLAVDEDGVFQIDAALLADLDLPTNAGPAAVRLYSKGGAMLPERVGEPYPTDLQEVALLEIGNGDATWDAGERLVFYGEGEDVWTWNDQAADFRRTENLYSEQTFYYLKVGGEGSRMATLQNREANEYSTSYTQRLRWEEELDNLLFYSKSQFSGQGSGQEWFGQLLKTNRTVRRPELFNFGQIVPGAEGKLHARFAASAIVRGSRFQLSANESRFNTPSVPISVRGDANSEFAAVVEISEPISLDKANIDVQVDYPGNSETALGWIDFVQITYPSQLRYTGSPLTFRSALDTGTVSFGYEISEATSDLRVLDITDPLRPDVVDAQNSGQRLRFGYAREAAGAPREFVAFDAAVDAPRPEVVGELANSNLHAIQEADMVIVYGEGLGPSAERLAEHRRNYNDYKVVVADVNTIFEEFGGGRPTPTAIRGLTTMLHQRDPGFRYLLLLGDGTFDPRGIQRAEGNLIPTYQTGNALWEVSAYPTDDYFALLDEGEGRDSGFLLRGGIDLGVGRIPATTPLQANTVVDKIIRYESDSDLLGEWRLRTVFVADDEDNDKHLRDIDGIARLNSSISEKYNQVKVYVDAYEQVPTTGGIKIPRAAEAINLNMFRGNLLTTYLGHGGPSGWGQERFLNSPDIEKWENRNAFTVLVTATCTFTGFDDPDRVVAGEKVLFKEDGGAVASLSTTRPVYINDNELLARRTHEVLLNDSLARSEGLGYLLAIAKNTSRAQTSNNRKYAMFGDPAMRLGVPKLDVVVTRFDSSAAAVDTADITTLPAIEALRPVSVSGEVHTPSGQLAADFNGEIRVTVFDQVRISRTLGQDAKSSSRNFERQDAVLFTGRATVEAGIWTASFMLPKDMTASRGRGRLSLYALSPDGRDAGGLYEGFVVDGLATPSIADDTPPVVEVFMGDENFVPGGITAEDPVIYARFTDDTGINVSGASIGHDLSATLRGVSEENYVLNDFYQAETDNFSRGEVRYPVFDLPEGEYALTVRAWDLANNTGTGETTFLVSNDAGLALRRVLNYPNPFVDATCFQFEHTAAGQFVEVQVDVYTSSGRRVRSLRFDGLAEGNRFGNTNCIAWDGTDDFGQELARGVYLYRISMRTEGGTRSGSSDFERLVVLK